MRQNKVSRCSCRATQPQAELSALTTELVAPCDSRLFLPQAIIRQAQPTIDPERFETRALAVPWAEEERTGHRPSLVTVSNPAIGAVN